MGRLLLASTVAAALLGCGKAPPPPTPGGTALMKFDVSTQLRNGTMPRPPKGSTYGNIYLQEDVSISGPRTGAMGFQGITVDGLDLTAGQSTQAFTTMTLNPGKYVFLGFLDTNADGATSMDPDTGDLVTLPTTNQFEIIDQKQIDRLVVFDLVYN